MQIINFDGYGQPRDGVEVRTGDVLLLIRGDEISVVRVVLPDQDQRGPALYDATNMTDLLGEARRLYLEAWPEGLPRHRHWTLRCPSELAARARFQ